MWGRCLFAGVAALHAAGATAGELPMIAFVAGLGYHELTSEEAVGPDPGAVALSADLTGDGVPDEVRILLNPERGDGMIVVVSVTSKIDTYVLARVGVDVAKRLRVYLTQANGRAGLLTVQPDGGRAIEQFDGEEFQTVSATDRS